MQNESTLGDVLYAGHWNVLVLESDWVELVQSVRAGNAFALHALLERAHAPVFHLGQRILGTQRAAEDVTLDVFWDLWRGVVRHDPSGPSVLGWIMNLARAKALERLNMRPRAGRPIDLAAPLIEPPLESIQAGMARRMAVSTGGRPLVPPSRQWVEPEWKQVAPGISCKLLATDTKIHRVSMLVRLDAAAEYPPHTHAGTEELHLLDGELWIDERKLVPGEYNYAVEGTGDQRVWSERGCMCFLMTSTKDRLG